MSNLKQQLLSKVSICQLMNDLHIFSAFQLLLLVCSVFPADAVCLFVNNDLQGALSEFYVLNFITLRTNSAELHLLTNVMQRRRDKISGLH